MPEKNQVVCATRSVVDGRCFPLMPSGEGSKSVPVSSTLIMYKNTVYLVLQQEQKPMFDI